MESEISACTNRHASDAGARLQLAELFVRAHEGEAGAPAQLMLMELIPPAQ